MLRTETIDRGIRRRLRTVAGGALALALCIAPTDRGLAQDVVPLNPFSTLQGGTGSVEGDIAKVLLPYSPYVFDLVVALSRSFVAITYDARRYDPLTNTFVVQGLDISRKEFKASVQRIRIGAATSVYEGLTVDTRQFTLEPEFREALKTLDSEIVKGDIVTSIMADAASATYDVDVLADLDKIGKVSFAARVSGFHVLVPLGNEFSDIDGDGDTDTFENGGASEEPIVVGHLESASLYFDDAGVAEAAFALASEAQNLSKEEMQGIIGSTIQLLVSSLFEGLPGGASPELQRRAVVWSATLQAFLADPEHLAITFRPKEPFALDRLQSGVVTAAIIEDLNPDVSRESSAVALLDPATAVPGVDDLTGARRLIEGVGLPQDIEAGLAIALPKALGGDAEALRVAVRGIVLDPAGAAAAPTNADAYGLLLVARASGQPVPDATLKTFDAILPVEVIDRTANDAQNRWFETETGAAQRQALGEALSNRDWAAVRKLSFDLYEGLRIPRNLRQAYMGATMAAAGGDRIAATLRDDLRRAVREKQLTFGLEAADAEVASIWKGILAGAPPDATDDVPSSTPTPQ